MLPDAGDIHWVDLDPLQGSEKAGRRPALILSALALHEVSKRILICPITSRNLAWSTTVALPSTMKMTGVVLADQVRAIDRSVRLREFIERAPVDLLLEVRAKLAVLLGIAMP